MTRLRERTRALMERYPLYPAARGGAGLAAPATRRTRCRPPHYAGSAMELETDLEHVTLGQGPTPVPELT